MRRGRKAAAQAVAVRTTMNTRFLMIAILVATTFVTTAAAEGAIEAAAETYEPGKCIYLNPDDPSNPIDVFDCEDAAKP